MDSYHTLFTRRVGIFVLSLLILLDCYFHIYVYYNVLQGPGKRKIHDLYEMRKTRNATRVFYKYPLNNDMEATMDFKGVCNSSYYWFITMKHMFKDISAEAAPIYLNNTPTCKLNDSLEPIYVNKTIPELNWLEEQNLDVKLGGYYAPAHCRAVNRVAIIIPFRGRLASLYILLRYLHPLLKKQLLEYRIFVIEQYGRELFNKGTLYNIAFLESQRFGAWHCLVFHDVDLIPEDERISYACPEHPTLMAPTNNSWRMKSSGGIAVLTPEQYESVNGYSNMFWDWGIEDEDFYNKLESKNYTIVKHNTSEAQYKSLFPKVQKKKRLVLSTSKMPFRRGDLTTTKYNLIKISQDKLFTHILADVNPMKLKLDPKSLMQRLMNVDGKMLYAPEDLTV